MARTTARRDQVLPALAELFREHGYHGTSLAHVTAATGLGKGSIYNFFPRGKDEMAAAVLSHVDDWFERQVFAPLAAAGDLAAGAQTGQMAAVEDMFASVTDYFRSGQRVCLVGAFALGDARDAFASRIDAYFARWIAALSRALQAGGIAPGMADDLAEEAVAVIQGAIVLARTNRSDGAFARVTGGQKRRLLDALKAAGRASA